MANDKVVKFWRGSRSAYDSLTSYDFWTRYTVKEADGRRNEYFGTKHVNEPTGQLYPVLDVLTVAEFQAQVASMSTGDRYLVGSDATFNEDGSIATDATYYVVEIAPDKSQSVVNPLGNHSVRVVSNNCWNYQVVNGKLISYEAVIDCGTF